MMNCDSPEARGSKKKRLEATPINEKNNTPVDITRDLEKGKDSDEHLRSKKTLTVIVYIQLVLSLLSLNPFTFYAGYYQCLTPLKRLDDDNLTGNVKQILRKIKNQVWCIQICITFWIVLLVLFILFATKSIKI